MPGVTSIFEKNIKRYIEQCSLNIQRINGGSPYNKHILLRELNKSCCGDRRHLIAGAQDTLLWCHETSHQGDIRYLFAGTQDMRLAEPQDTRLVESQDICLVEAQGLCCVES